MTKQANDGRFQAHAEFRVWLLRRLEREFSGPRHPEYRVFAAYRVQASVSALVNAGDLAGARDKVELLLASDTWWRDLPNPIGDHTKCAAAARCGRAILNAAKEQP